MAFGQRSRWPLVLWLLLLAVPARADVRKLTLPQLIELARARSRFASVARAELRGRRDGAAGHAGCAGRPSRGGAGGAGGGQRGGEARGAGGGCGGGARCAE